MPAQVYEYKPACSITSQASDLQQRSQNGDAARSCTRLRARQRRHAAIGRPNAVAENIYAPPLRSAAKSGANAAPRQNALLRAPVLAAQC
jgi:hypothetical protein